MGLGLLRDIEVEIKIEIEKNIRMKYQNSSCMLLMFPKVLKLITF